MWSPNVCAKLEYMSNDRVLKRRQESTTWFIGIGLAIVLGFSGLCASIVWKLHDSDYEQARGVATNLVSSIAGQVDRNIELYDLSLQAVVDGIKLPEINTISRELRQVVLFDRAATAKDLGSILVLDQTGKVIVDSRTLDVQEKNYADRDFFQVHFNNSHFGLFISRPWVTDAGDYLVSFSRRITGADGLFAGVVVGSMRLSYFDGLFKAVKLDEKDAMTLINTDGTILMRAPLDINVIGRNIGSAPFFGRLPNARFGSFEATSVVDGIERLFVYHRIGPHPLLMIMGLSNDKILADWRQTAWLVGALLLTLCAITMLLGTSLVNALKRRYVAENKLAVLAATDSLTGLANRRRFDEVFEAEWRRARRLQSSISLLMIDADNFKLYNDTHGHQAGDKALLLIADCIKSGTRRAADLGARYGGEEFAVVLPGHTASAAMQVAEEIRENVMTLRSLQKAQHSIIPIIPTVSIGIASVIPPMGMSTEDLIEFADKALYEAKKQGRNRAIAAPTRFAKRVA